MSIPQASVAATIAYTAQSVSNTGGTAKEVFTDSVAADLTANATKAFSYLADGGTHNANLAAGTSTTFTLSALTGALGSVAFAKVLAFVFINKSSTDALAIGGAATHPWAPLASAISIPPGGAYILLVPGSTGVAVTAGSSDQVKVDATGAGAAVPFSLSVIGA
jgi:hypothetical protein